MAAIRNIATALGLAFLLAAAFLAWRDTHPVLTDSQLLLAELQNARSAIEDRSATRVSHYLAHDFSYNATPRTDFYNMMVGAFWQWRDVDLKLTNQRATIDGPAKATTTGHFVVSFRPAQDAASETHNGEFTLHWIKQDGQWKVLSAESTNVNFDAG